MHAAARFVERVDGLVGQGAVGEVAVGEAHAGRQGGVGVVHIMVLLVAAAQVVQDLQRFVGRGRLELYLLEAAFECAVLFDGFAVFVDGGSADALHFAACQGRFQDIGGIETARRRTGTDNRVYLIDEKNDFIVLFEFFDELAQTFFKLSAILRAGHDGRHVERHDALSCEHARGFAAGDALREAFHDRALAHAGVADENRVVLLAAAEYLHHTLRFALAPHHGIQSALGGNGGEVGAEMVDDGRIGLFLGARACRLLVAGGLAGGGEVFGRHVVGIVVVNAKRAFGQFHAEAFANVFVGHTALFEQSACGVVLFAEHGQEDMLHAGGAFARAARLKCGEAHEIGRFLVERGALDVFRFIGGQCLLHFHAAAQGVRCFQQQGFRIYFPRGEQTLYF